MLLKKLVWALPCLMLNFQAYAAEGDPEIKTGTINLSAVQDENSPTVFTTNMGNKALGKFFLYHQLTSNGQHVINGNAQFKNMSQKPVYLVYYIALTDSDGKLIASTDGSLDLGVGSNIHEFASALMPIPPNLIDKINKYQIVYYESAKHIGMQ